MSGGSPHHPSARTPIMPSSVKSTTFPLDEPSLAGCGGAVVSWKPTQVMLDSGGQHLPE
jgi:hypothetical protein